jgi:type II secretory pathway pseudopilin PulG
MKRRALGQEGFTLIELTVSLVAGLIVALGIVGLSRDATHTFHEEMRSSAAEANLRTAIDRLRADLSRAGYMSTGNVSTDPMIAKVPGTANPIPPALKGLFGLASIYLQPGASLNETPLSAQQQPAMNPDIIEIAGNMTSTDQYEVVAIEPNAGACGGTQIDLDTQSPSMFRILGVGGLAELNNIFQPVANAAGQFIVRLVDKTGHSQFLLTCTGQPAAGQAGAKVFLNIDPATPVLMANNTGTVGGLAGYGSGALVNPVQIVQWQLKGQNTEPAQDVASPLGRLPLTPTAPDPGKYDLVRSYVDAVTGQIIPQTTEIVAEYAVDLSFAFSVDAGPNALQPVLQTFPFDSPANQLWAQAVGANPVLGQPNPARIRSVRVRLVTRAAEVDRTATVGVPNPTGPFTYRYCVLPGGCDPLGTAGILQYARARTLTAEVALPNQSRSYY